MITQSPQARILSREDQRVWVVVRLLAIAEHERYRKSRPVQDVRSLREEPLEYTVVPRLNITLPP